MKEAKAVERVRAENEISYRDAIIQIKRDKPPVQTLSSNNHALSSQSTSIV